MKNEKSTPEGYFNSADMNAYFDTLPPIVQETILQSGASPKDISQLQNLADAFK